MTIRAMETNTMALIQTSSIQAIMTLPQRLSFSAQLPNCDFATCWHVELSKLSVLQLSFNIHSSNGCSCPIKSYQVLSFENSHWAGLGRILSVACATTEKHLCPVSTFSYFRGKAFLGKPAKFTFVGNKDVNS